MPFSCWEHMAGPAWLLPPPTQCMQGVLGAAARGAPLVRHGGGPPAGAAGRHARQLSSVEQLLHAWPANSWGQCIVPCLPVCCHMAIHSSSHSMLPLFNRW